MPYTYKPNERARKRILYARNTAYAAAAKNRPCTDCGGEYPHYVMEFDHCRGTKSFNISGAATRSLAVLEAEIAKCDVICANCHCKRTYKRRSEQ